MITEATARPLLELERGSIDIAITSSRTRNKKLWVQDLFSDELVAVVAKDHPWAEAKGIAIKEFRHIHLLAYSANPMDSDFVREILLPAGVVPLKVSGIQFTEALLEFARACLGVAVVAKWTVGNLSNCDELVSIRIGQNGLHRNWKAVWMCNHPKPEILMTFAKMLVSDRVPAKRSRSSETDARHYSDSTVAEFLANPKDFLWSGLTMKTANWRAISRDFQGTTSGFLCTSDCVAERKTF
jgi:LysR family transcriptional regulator, regulator for metE and metH